MVLVDLEASVYLREVAGSRAGDDVGTETVERWKRSHRRGRGGEHGSGHPQAIVRVCQLGESTRECLLALDVPGVGAGGVHVSIRAASERRRRRTEEEQPILHDWATEGSANLVLIVGLFLLPKVGNGPVVGRIQHESLHRAGADFVALIVDMPFAKELVAPGPGHRADDAAERSTELGRHAGRLDLHFLEVLEHCVLAGTAVDQAVGHDAVHRVRVLATAGTVHLDPALDVALSDCGQREGHRLEASRLGKPFELFGVDAV
jgi:hypothetical protein